MENLINLDKSVESTIKCPVCKKGQIVFSHTAQVALIPTECGKLKVMNNTKNYNFFDQDLLGTCDSCRNESDGRGEGHPEITKLLRSDAFDTYEHEEPLKTDFEAIIYVIEDYIHDKEQQRDGTSIPAMFFCHDADVENAKKAIEILKSEKWVKLNS